MNNEDFDMSPALDRERNQALVNADISKSYEEFLAIFNRYYAEDVEVGSDTTPVPLTGKANVLPVLLNFLAPLHMMAEIGRSVTMHWSSARRWDGSLVIYERHFDHRQIGGPLTFIDLDVDGSVRRNANARPSSQPSRAVISPVMLVARRWAER